MAEFTNEEKQQLDTFILMHNQHRSGFRAIRDEDRDVTNNITINNFNFIRDLEPELRARIINQIRELNAIDVRLLDALTRLNNDVSDSLAVQLVILQYRSILRFIRNNIPGPGPNELITLLEQKIKIVNQLLEERAPAPPAPPARPEGPEPPAGPERPAEPDDAGRNKYMIKDVEYREKYMKYKNKYLGLKNKLN